MRHNRSQVRQRRSHHALSASSLTTCAHCGATRRPHHMCLSCGYYRGRQVLDLTKEKTKREARMKAKREAIRGETGSTPAPKPVEKKEEKVAAPKKEKKEKKPLEKKTGLKAT